MFARASALVSAVECRHVALHRAWLNMGSAGKGRFSKNVLQKKKGILSIIYLSNKNTNPHLRYR